jgi:hypothetical protein
VDDEEHKKKNGKKIHRTPTFIICCANLPYIQTVVNLILSAVKAKI